MIGSGSRQSFWICGTRSWRLRLAATMQALRRSLVRLARMSGEPAKRAR